MLFKLAHYILKKFPKLWEFIEDINSLLFALLYHNRLKKLTDLASPKDAQALADFFARQPESVYTYFHPHAFDVKRLTKLLKRRSMVIHVIYQDDIIIGYCFLRCFFIGKGYRGYIVDANMRGKGIGKKLNIWLYNTGLTLKIKTYTTINDSNIASLRAAQATALLKVVKKMENGDTLYECTPISI